MSRPSGTRIHDLLSAAAAEQPDRLAVVAPNGSTTSFDLLDQQVRSIAGWISRRSGLGDRIAIIADNDLAYVQLYYAVPRSGRILALINQRLSPQDQAVLLAAAEPTIVFGAAEHLNALQGVSEFPWGADHVVAFESDRWSAIVDYGGDCPDHTGPDDVAWLAFTSGSTGRPKGVLHSHRSLVAAAEGTVLGRSVKSGDVYLLPFPMCHIAGYNVLVRHAAQSTVVLSTHFRPESFVDAVNTHGVTSCSLAPTMLHALLAHLDQSGATMPTLREVAYGSAAISADLMNRAIDKLAIDFNQGYGMTESGGNVCFLDALDHRRGTHGDESILRTVGRPHPSVEVAVIDDAGNSLQPGEVGEIVVRGKQVMTGYWRDDAATEAVLVDGWLRTGDMGRFDAEGRLSVVDRRKDIIITGGENVASREVEDALSTHPDVDMAAVVGVPDEYWGEAVCAVVVPVEGRTPHDHELMAHVKERISPFKRPRHVVFVSELPLTTNGKIAKDVVREIARRSVAGSLGAPHVLTSGAHSADQRI